MSSKDFTISQKDIDALDKSIESLHKQLEKTSFGYSATVTFMGHDCNEIIDIKIIVPNKITEVKFADGNKEKMIVQPPDEFDLEKCLYIALAKKNFRSTLTFDGVLRKADELKYIKYYNKIVRNGLKLFDKKEQEKKKKEEEDEVKRLRDEKWSKKRSDYKKRRALRKREQRVEEQEEACLRAMRVIKEDEDD